MAVLVLMGGHCVSPGGRAQGLRRKHFSSAPQGWVWGAQKAVSSQTPRAGVRAVTTRVNRPVHPAPGPAGPLWPGGSGQPTGAGVVSLCMGTGVQRRGPAWGPVSPLLSPPPGPSPAAPGGACPFCEAGSFLGPRRTSLRGPQEDLRRTCLAGGGRCLRAEVRREDLSRPGRPPRALRQGEGGGWQGLPP